MRVFRRGKVWYCWFYENGVRVQRSTQCHDRRAAEARAREFERDASDPAHAAARKATLSDALQLLLRLDEEEIRAGRRSADTKEFHERKAGHLVRVLETRDGARVGFPLTNLGAPEADAYISKRRMEGAGGGHHGRQGAVRPPQGAPSRPARPPVARPRRGGRIRCSDPVWRSPGEVGRVGPWDPAQQIRCSQGGQSAVGCSSADGATGGGTVRGPTSAASSWGSSRARV